MRRPIAWLLILAAAGPAVGRAGGVEVTPFIGLRVGGDFEDVAGVDAELDESSSWGLVVDVPLVREIQLELLFSRQETDLVAGGFFGSPELFEVTVDYYQVGAMHEWEGQKIRPFFAGTAGLAEFNPEGQGLKSETRFAFSLGGGAKFFVHRHVGFRLDGRVFAAYFDGSRRLFCSPAGCIARVSGSLLLQAELAAGLILKF